MTQQKKTYRGTSCDKQINSINLKFLLDKNDSQPNSGCP